MTGLKERNSYMVAANTVELITRSTTEALKQLGHGDAASAPEMQQVADAAAAKIQVKVNELK